MGFLKTINNIYKTVKENKEICCKNLNDSIEQLNISMQESCKKKELEILEKYKTMYEDYRDNITDEDHVAPDAIQKYLKGSITKEEYKLKNLIYKQLVLDSIQKVEEGKISHKTFFEIIYNRSK